jgi:hypothetical protein
MKKTLRMGCRQHLITRCKVKNHEVSRLTSFILPTKNKHFLGEAIMNNKIIYGIDITRQVKGQ